MLGEGVHDRLIAIVEATGGQARPDRERAGDPAALVERRHDRRPDSLGGELGLGLGGFGGADDDRPAIFERRPREQVDGAGIAPALEQPLAGAVRGDEPGRRAVFGSEQADRDEDISDALLELFGEQLQDLVQCRAVDDRPLELGEALEQRLAFAQRVDQNCRVALFVVVGHARQV